MGSAMVLPIQLGNESNVALVCMTLSCRGVLEERPLLIPLQAKLLLGLLIVRS